MELSCFLLNIQVVSPYWLPPVKDCNSIAKMLTVLHLQWKCDHPCGPWKLLLYKNTRFTWSIRETWSSLFLNSLPANLSKNDQFLGSWFEMFMLKFVPSRGNTPIPGESFVIALANTLDKKLAISSYPNSI